MGKVNVSLHLDNAKETAKETAILFDVQTDNKRFRISSGLKVKPKDFNYSNHQFRKGVSGHSNKNALLKKYKADIEDVCNRALLQDIPVTKEYVKGNVDFTGTKEKQNSFYDCLDRYIAFRKNSIKPIVLGRYTLLKKEIQAFSVKHNFTITFESINEKFEKDFKQYLYDKGLQDGGLHVYFSKIKAFMKWAVENGFTQNQKFRKFSYPRHEPMIHPLTPEELKEFEKLKLIGSQDLVKDIFLFQCYTGLRISDTMNLKPENIKGNTIRDFTLKTRELVFIPLIDRSLQIVGKYKQQSKKSGFVFPSLSTDKIRKHLKDVGKLAGLTYTISKVILRGIEREEISFPRYESLGTHDARRTFITLSLSKGMNAQMLMRVTGHQKLENLERYIRFTDTDIEDTLKFAWKKI
jgi:integrase